MKFLNTIRSYEVEDVEKIEGKVDMCLFPVF